MDTSTPKAAGTPYPSAINSLNDEEGSVIWKRVLYKPLNFGIIFLNFPIISITVFFFGLVEMNDVVYDHWNGLQSPII